jgi:ElaB/YqjD/DUF883 family membrane-anchored ribosome-binding protein
LTGAEFLSDRTVQAGSLPELETTSMSSRSNLAHGTADTAEGAARDTANTASTAAREIRQDMAALREDVARLAQQVGHLLLARSGATWRRARSGVAGVVSEAQEKGVEAVDAVRGIGDEMVDQIGQSLRKRPYRTVALAIGIGFLFGATWRR